jgi:hypothetical protein
LDLFSRLAWPHCRLHRCRSLDRPLARFTCFAESDRSRKCQCP